MVYLEIDEVMAVHDEMIALFGGRSGIRDFTLLHSATARPQATFGGKDLYKNTFDKATALIHPLTLNHPFEDGNKRTALTSCARFLFINGWILLTPLEKTLEFTLAIDGHRLSFNQISRWLKKHSKKL